MFSTPLTCCSIGAATVSATVSELAPGKIADTSTVGGVISGYCAIGSVQTAMPPAKVITIESTEAKIGRSIKKRENIGFSGQWSVVSGPWSEVRENDSCCDDASPFAPAELGGAGLR